MLQVLQVTEAVILFRTKLSSSVATQQVLVLSIHTGKVPLAGVREKDVYEAPKNSLTIFYNNQRQIVTKK